MNHNIRNKIERTVADNSSTIKRPPKRPHNKTGRRQFVGVKLTPEELAKLEALIKTNTETTGMQASKSSVISDLINKAA